MSVMEKRMRQEKLPVTPERAGALLREHFARVTPEEFLENLRAFCPELYKTITAAGEGAAGEARTE